MAIITVKNLTRSYKTYKRGHGFSAAIKSIFKREVVISHAVKGITFSIDEGEIVGFVGPNGAGKSTTIKMLTGILYPSSGDVHVLEFNPWDDRKKYVCNIGVVLGQKSQLWWDLPPIDSFYLMKGIYAIPEREFKERLDAMVAMLGVEQIMQRPSRDLSLGERMKCEFIMALLHNPKVLFLDEPTIGVDAIAKEEIRDFLKEINAKYKTTIILTTHDMDDIEEVCKRIIIIDKGLLIYDGSLDKLKNKYIKTKTIDVDYSVVSNKKKFDALVKSAELVAKRKQFISIKIQKKETPKFVKEFMLSCDVVDLLVHEPDLEDIIKEIYVGK